MTPHGSSSSEIVPGEHSKSTRARNDLTLRAILAGLFCGALGCLSNVYFALQTGYASETAMPASLIGFAIFQPFRNLLRFPFTAGENALVQAVAGAMSFMPVTASFVGVIPALEHLIVEAENGPIRLSWMQLLAWPFGLLFFGCVFVVPFRKYFIVRQRLPFPTATATAVMIATLHNDYKSCNHSSRPEGEEEALLGPRPSSPCNDVVPVGPTISPAVPSHDPKAVIKVLFLSGAVSGLYTLLAYFVPILRNLPVFGRTAAETWLWDVDLSPGFVGQGMFTGLPITSHMLLGTLVGWGFLSPLAKHKNWAPGAVGDWENGSRGWIIWISLASILADCFVKLTWLCVSIVVRLKVDIKSMSLLVKGRSQPDYSLITSESGDVLVDEDRNSSTSHTQGNGGEHSNLLRASPFGIKTFLVSLAGSILIGILCTKLALFTYVPTYAVLLAILISLPLCIVGVQALGETDFIPASGIAKVSQFVFALVVPQSNPNAIIINLVAGAVAEASACQASEVTFDFKVANDLGASYMTQFAGYMIGSVFGAFLAGATYRLCSSVYPVPGPMFQIPTAHIYLLTARLVNGGNFPPQAANFALAFAVFFAAIAVFKIYSADRWWQPLIPSGTAFAIGIYTTPSFILSRVLGALIQWYGCRKKDGEGAIMSVASGMILGEGVVGILTVGMASFDVPHV